MGISIISKILPRLVPGRWLVALFVVATTTAAAATRAIRQHGDERRLQQQQEAVIQPQPSPALTVPTATAPQPTTSVVYDDAENPYHIPAPPSSQIMSQPSAGGATGATGAAAPALTPEQMDSMVTWCGLDNDFVCYHGAICVQGAPNFDNYQLPDGTVLAIHKVDEFMMTIQTDHPHHCQCSDAWTGIQCDIPVTACGGGGIGGHYCYNKGTCIAGLDEIHDNDQLYCDCSRAFDDEGNHWVGKNCEQKVETFCDETKSNFCLNGGVCNPNYPWQGEPCQCTSGVEGPHCEYKSSQVPDCTMRCENGGVCQLGVHPTAATVAAANNDQSQQQQPAITSSVPFQFCACPDQWSGDDCTIPSVPCGDRFCYHGSVCVQRVVDSEAVFHCDCRQTDNGVTAYAGRFCEFQATSFCLSTTSNGGTSGIGVDGGSNLNGNLFCVNNGACRDDPYMGCSCDVEKYSGFSCEFEVAGPAAPAPTPNGASTPATTPTASSSATVPVTCDLDCGEHGACRNGIKDISALGDAAYAASLNETHDGSFQHCVCQDGYVGLRCDQIVQVCPDGQQKCLHGSTCYQKGQEYRCNCQDVVGVNDETLSSHAGDSCEHAATSTCLLHPQNGPAKPLSFCVNHGVCKQLVGPDDAHQGCSCTAGWTGPHCEMRDQALASQPAPQPTQSAPLPAPVSPFNPLPETIPSDPGSEQEPPRDHASFVPNRSSTTTTQSGDTDKGRVGLIVGITLSFVIVIAALISYRARTTRRRFKNDDVGRAVEWSDSRYLDNPPEQINLAPRRVSVCIENDAQLPHNGNNNVHEDVYMASIASPSRDPMATVLAPPPPQGPDKEDSQGPQVYIGPPRDEDGHVLHSVEII